MANFFLFDLLTYFPYVMPIPYGKRILYAGFKNLVDVD